VKAFEDEAADAGFSTERFSASGVAKAACGSEAPELPPIVGDAAPTNAPSPAPTPAANTAFIEFDLDFNSFFQAHKNDSKGIAVTLRLNCNDSKTCSQGLEETEKFLSKEADVKNLFLGITDWSYETPKVTNVLVDFEPCLPPTNKTQYLSQNNLVIEEVNLSPKKFKVNVSCAFGYLSLDNALQVAVCTDPGSEYLITDADSCVPACIRSSGRADNAVDDEIMNYTYDGESEHDGIKYGLYQDPFPVTLSCKSGFEPEGVVVQPVCDNPGDVYLGSISCAEITPSPTVSPTMPPTPAPPLPQTGFRFNLTIEAQCEQKTIVKLQDGISNTLVALAKHQQTDVAMQYSPACIDDPVSGDPELKVYVEACCGIEDKCNDFSNLMEQILSVPALKAGAFTTHNGWMYDMPIFEDFSFSNSTSTCTITPSPTPFTMAPSPSPPIPSPVPVPESDFGDPKIEFSLLTLDDEAPNIVKTTVLNYF